MGDQQICTVVFVCCVKVKNLTSAAFVTQRPISGLNSKRDKVNELTMPHMTGHVVFNDRKVFQYRPVLLVSST